MPNKHALHQRSGHALPPNLGSWVELRVVLPGGRSVRAGAVGNKPAELGRQSRLFKGQDAVDDGKLEADKGRELVALS